MLVGEDDVGDLRVVRSLFNFLVLCCFDSRLVLCLLREAMAFEDSADRYGRRRSITLAAFVRAKGFAQLDDGDPFRDFFYAFGSAGSVFETMRVVSFRRSVADFFDVDRCFVREEVDDGGLTRVVVDSAVDFFTGIRYAFSGDRFVFVLGNFLIDGLGSGVDLSRERVERFICARVVGD